ncbi:MAG: DUF192 domain-containing protein [Cyanobacteria bacterium P01_F01_bin.153]
MYFGSPKALVLGALGVALLVGNCAWAVNMDQDQSVSAESLAQGSAGDICPQYGNIAGKVTFFPSGTPSEANTNLGVEINLEIAETPDQQRCGLMFRDRLPDNRGMGFPFDPPDRVSFWMKNVPVALDMVFVERIPDDRSNRPEPTSQESYQVLDIITAPPCTNDPCPTYGPNGKVAWVIELAEGRTEAMGVQKGDHLHIQWQQPQ